MEKRLVVAVLISIGFLLLWGTVAPKFFPQLAQSRPRPAATGVKTTAPASATSTAGTTQSPGASQSAAVSAATLVAPKADGEVIRGEREIISTIDTPTYLARFSSRGAQLTSFTLKGFPPMCRFEPTCSIYAMGAVEKFGVLRGSWLAARRLFRCHPLNPGGWDPVP